MTRVALRLVRDALVRFLHKRKPMSDRPEETLETRHLQRVYSIRTHMRTTKHANVTHICMYTNACAQTKTLFVVHEHRALSFRS